MKISKALNLICVLFLAWNMAGCVHPQGTLADGTIIFRSNKDGRFDLYTMDLDGLKYKKLDGFPYLASAPIDNQDFVASPDGKKIAYDLCLGKESNCEIHVMDIETGIFANLTENGASDFGPAWSPDGKHIAFISNRDTTLIKATLNSWTDNIYIMDIGGTNVRRLTIGNMNCYYGSLHWSPDGNKLAFTTFRPGRGITAVNISLANLSDSNLINLTSPSDLLLKVEAWTPDSKRIVYSAYGSKSRNLYVMNLDGSGQISLTSNTWVTSVSLSPNGEHVVFSSLEMEGDRKYSRLYSMKVDGTGLVTLSKSPSPYDTSPSWSPDGKYIVFASTLDGGKYHLYIMNSDGTNQRRLTNYPNEEAAPIWLP